MRERIRPTRSGLFTIELMISVGVFSLCAAICVGLFVRAEVISRDSADLNRAVTEARSVAECFKAVGGDLERTARLTGGEAAAGALSLRYDEGWNKLEAGAEGTFELTLLTAPGDGFTAVSLWVKRQDGGAQDGNADPEKELLAWEIAVLEVAS